MLYLREIQMQNFGPYRGVNTLSFSSDNGVYVVYGENMRGKTTLLNAVRFALFGHVLGRSERKIDPVKLLNKAARADGENILSVQLTLLRNESPVVIRRQWSVALDSGDVSDEIHVVDDGNAVAKDSIARFLHELLPEGVSRFFLFDGELLQQYEELLSDESQTGRRITEAIEQVLGVPVLTNLRADLSQALDNARRAEMRAAKKHQATEKIAAVLENLDEVLASAREELDCVEDELEITRKEKDEVERLLEKSSAVEGLIAEQKAAREQIQELETQVQDKSRELSVFLESAWKWPLHDMVGALRDQMMQRLLDAEQARREQQWIETIIELQRQAKNDGRCGVCGSSDLSAIEEAGSDGSDGDIDDAALESIRDRVALLKQLDIEPGGEGGAVAISAQIGEARAGLVRQKQRLEEIDLELSTKSPDEVRAAREKLKPLLIAFQDLARARKDVQARIQDCEQQIKTAEKKLDSGSGVALTTETKRRELVAKLLEGASKAVIDYREALRDSVARDASDIFMELTTEKEFGGLAINDQYGLEIRLPGGDVQEIRSSGAEHVVALALLGALQKNAPLRGPLFVDSPFGRLDESHTRNIVGALPGFAPQVILFVYKQELEPDLAGSILKNSLAGEFQLERVSATETRIVPIE